MAFGRKVEDTADAGKVPDFLQTLGQLRRITADIEKSLPRQHRSIVGFGGIKTRGAGEAGLIAVEQLQDAGFERVKSGN